MKKLIFATNNKGKLKEMQLLLPSIEIISLEDIKWTEEIDEPFDTFHENALIKAVTIFKATQLPVLSDDSGLCIEALMGAPGVHSAYYGGHPRTDQKNIDKVLDEMKGIEQRAAYFKAVLCLIWDGQVHYFEVVLMVILQINKWVWMALVMTLFLYLQVIQKALLNYPWMLKIN